MKSDSLSVTTVVAVDAAAAFEVFTREVDLWWKRAPRFRRGGAMRLEPGVGGRFLDGDDEIARVSEWEPGRKLTLAWRGGPFFRGILGTFWAELLVALNSRITKR